MLYAWDGTRPSLSWVDLVMTSSVSALAVTMNLFSLFKALSSSSYRVGFTIFWKSLLYTWVNTVIVDAPVRSLRASRQLPDSIRS